MHNNFDSLKPLSVFAIFSQKKVRNHLSERGGYILEYDKWFASQRRDLKPCACRKYSRYMDTRPCFPPFCRRETIL